MAYPAILLPQLSFKEITEGFEEGWLCRTFPDQDGWYDFPTPEWVFFNKWEELYDYSTNYLGHFEVEHNFIALCGEKKRYFQAYWNFTDEVLTPVIEEDFTEDRSKKTFFLPISLIHKKIKIPFNRPPKNAPDGLTAIVAHTPTNSNFWHFSIRWVDANGIIIKPSDSKWKEERIATMRALLAEMISWEIPDGTVLNEAVFTRNI